MPRPYSIDSTFNAYFPLLHTRPQFDESVQEDPPPSRELVVTDHDCTAALGKMMLMKTALEDNPTQMRVVWLPLFFVPSRSFNFEENVRVLARILQLTTPNALNLRCLVTRVGIPKSALETVRQILCPSLLACDSLVHVGVMQEGSSVNMTHGFIEFIDDIFSSTMGCCSLFVACWANRELGERLGLILQKRAAAYMSDARFHRITRIHCAFSSEGTELQALGVELSRSLRVCDFALDVEHYAPFQDRWDLAEYMRLRVKDEHLPLLSAALTTERCSLRGLCLLDLGSFHMDIRAAKVFGDALGSSQLEEITVFRPIAPRVLLAFAEGVGRSQLRHVRIACAGGSNLERSLGKILACSSLRELVMDVGISRKPLSEETLAHLFGHPGLEYCRIGELVPQDEAYTRMCDGNFAQSIRVLTMLLVKWVASFTEVAAVDINLFRIIRLLMVMPTN